MKAKCKCIDCGAPATVAMFSRLQRCGPCAKAAYQKERETASAIHAIHGMPGEPEPKHRPVGWDGKPAGTCDCPECGGEPDAMGEGCPW